MKIKIIRIQMKALNSYVLDLIEKSRKAGEQKAKDDPANQQITHWSDTSNQREFQKMWERYAKLRKQLEKDFPEIFSDLITKPVYPQHDDFSELSREIAYIIEILENLESENQSPISENYYPFAGESPPDNSPFTEAERKHISEELNNLENHLIKVAKENAETNESLKENLDKNISDIKDQIAESDQSTSKIGRKDWYLQFIGMFSNILVAISFSNDARIGLYGIITALFQNMAQYKILLLDQ